MNKSDGEKKRIDVCYICWFAQHQSLRLGYKYFVHFVQLLNNIPLHSAAFRKLVYERVCKYTYTNVICNNHEHLDNPLIWEMFKLAQIINAQNAIRIDLHA